MNEVFPSAQIGLKATVLLNNGVAMPWLGLGVYQTPEGKPTLDAIHWALEFGYRRVDTAALYGNERSVGEAVRSSGLPREQIFVTTKLWNDDQRKHRIRAAFEDSLQKLGLDYVDLYLVHWPVRTEIEATWKAFEELAQAGRVRAIGVSNFLIPDLERLLKAGSKTPTVNQIEFHPYLRSPQLLEFCRANKILVEAWSPLMQAGLLFKDPVLNALSKARGKTVAQIILRWDLQSGVATIPKSVHRERIIENGSVFDFSLSPEEMAQIDALDRNYHSGADPSNFNF